MRKTLPNLSKSKFLAGCQCLKRLYLQCYQRELAGETVQATQAIFDQGHEVGLVAQQRFDHGVLVDEDHQHFPEALSRTQQLLTDKTVPAIFEAAFAFEGIWIRVDILAREPQNRWRLIEVKSTTGVKDCHQLDVAIQQYVLKNCGIKTCAPCLMHLNRGYVYDGKKYDLDRLFTVEDLSDDVQSLQKDIPKQVAEQWKVLAGKEMPNIQPGPMCLDPYECEFFNVCNEQPPEHHVSYLPRMNANKLDQLKQMKVSLIPDVPESFPLSALQRRIRQCVKTGRPFFDGRLQEALDELSYPLYFVDFETSNPALPRYRGMCPYDQIAFQWSVHVQRKPRGKLEHHAFLAENGNDPRETFIQSLLKVLGVEGSIVVYNKAFEGRLLDEIGRWLPRYAGKINAIKKRLWDLLAAVRSHVYHPAFNGSFFLKAVLPALVPTMTYEGMDVAEGSQASLAYEAMVRGDLPKKEIVRLRKALLEYCKQDTLAMVKLLECLRQQ